MKHERNDYIHIVHEEMKVYTCQSMDEEHRNHFNQYSLHLCMYTERQMNTC